MSAMIVFMVPIVAIGERMMGAPVGLLVGGAAALSAGLAPIVELRLLSVAVRDAAADTGLWTASEGGRPT